MRELTIDGRRISDADPAYVIAEIGHNHGGSLTRALELVEAAEQCGCAAAKFQKRANKTLFTPSAFKAPYDNENSYGPTYGTHREHLELSKDNYKDVLDLGREVGLTVFATAFDETSADLLHSLRVPAFKVASGDLTNIPLLQHIAAFGLPMIVSTGGATWTDVDRAVNAIWPMNRKLALLHCTVGYPVHNHAELNLRAIPTMRDRYPEIVIGWSGHDTGIAMSVMAYTLGARIIEKHFTLNRTWKGTDQSFSLEPNGMRKLVRDLDRAREAFGTGDKVPYPSEAVALAKMQKCLVATRTLSEGHILARGDLKRCSPATTPGCLQPYMADTVLGFPLTHGIHQEEPLTYDHLHDKARA